MLTTLFHFAVASWYCFTLYYDNVYLDYPFPSKEFEDFPLKSRHAFMTMWCLVLQTTYFSIASLNDIFGTNAPGPKNRPVIRKAKDFLFSLAFPVATFVTIVFWGIYAVDKELILPEYIEKLFPWWVNHTMHTLILIVTVIELLVSPRKYPTRFTGMATIVALSVSYIVCINLFYIKTNLYVYPFLNVMPFPIALLVFASSPVVALLLYVTCEKLNNVVWPNRSYVNGKNK